MYRPDLGYRFLRNDFLAKKRLPFFIFLIVLSVQIVGCSAITGSDEDSPDYTHRYNFNDEPDGWTAMFSNYGVGREDFYELESGYRSLPTPLNTNRTGFYLSGENHSDDLNMFLKHRIDSLEPNKTYDVLFEVTFATEAPSGCVGAGGAPGEGVTVHAIASSTEPSRYIDDSLNQDFYRLYFAERYEGEAVSWYHETKIGDVANTRECEDGWQYELKTVTGEQQSVTTDATGNLWLFVGTRSGFEATTSLYYTEVNVRIE